MSEHIDVALGRWDEAAIRHLARGEGRWTDVKGRGSTYFIGNKLCGVVRARGDRGQYWIGRIEGFEWLITPDMPISRFQEVPGGRSLTHTAPKLFASREAAKREIETIVQSMPTVEEFEDFARRDKTE